MIWHFLCFPYGIFSVTYNICIFTCKWLFFLHLVSLCVCTSNKLLLSPSSHHPRHPLVEALHSLSTCGVNMLLVCSDIFLITLFLFPAHKKHWTVTLHSDKSMGHIPISLPSPSHLSLGWSAPANLIVHSPWAISCFWLSLFPFPAPFQLCGIIFDVAEPHTEFKMLMSPRFMELCYEAPMVCSPFLPQYLISSLLFIYYCKLILLYNLIALSNFHRFTLFLRGIGQYFHFMYEGFAPVNHNSLIYI